LELGGNAPCIVFDDADIDVAVKGSVSNIINDLFIQTMPNFLTLKLFFAIIIITLCKTLVN
jgi:Aldehyde dehydrogenase family